MKYPEDIKKTILVSHAYCADGATCEIMFRRAGGLFEKTLYALPSKLGKFVEDFIEELDGNFVIFADISFAKHEMYAVDLLEKRGIDFALLDHHKTAKHLEKYPWTLIDMDTCGCEMVRKYLGLTDENSKMLTDVVKDNDIWIKADKRSSQLLSLISFIGHRKYVNRFLGRDVLFEFFTPEEEDIIQIVESRKEERIIKAINNVRTFNLTWGDHDEKRCRIGYIFSDESDSSTLLNRLCSTRSDIDVGCQVFLDRKTVSLRSTNGYDVSELAAFYGGGGHAAASGHGISEAAIDGLILNIHGRVE